MSIRAVPLLVALGLLLTFVPWAAAAAEAVPPDLANVAVQYVNALGAGNHGQAWNLLSAESRASLTGADWEEAYQRRTPIRKPPDSALLQALAVSESADVIGDVLVRPNEAFISVTGTIDVTQDLILVRESVGWRVDLAASDGLNARRAAQLFLDALREEATASSSRSSRAFPGANLSLVSAVLVSDTTGYEVVSAEVEADTAHLVLVAQVPVSLVLQAGRAGPGWLIDLSRPLLPVVNEAGAPLDQAAALADQHACEAQLRQLVQAIRMYAASSDDQLPDPGRWLDQVRPHLQDAGVLHCPSDSAAGISYAMNSNLRGMRLREIGNPQQTPLLFESALHTDNPADAGESWATPARHPQGNLVAFADGTIRALPRPPSFRAIRGPSGGPRVTLPGAPRIRTRPLPRPLAP